MSKMNLKLKNQSIPSLVLETYKDCEVMARYAISNGIQIPELIGYKLMQIEGKVQKDYSRWKDLKARKKLDEQTKIEKENLEEKISKILLDDIQGLTRIHGRLSEIVAPVTPRSIEITEPAVGIKGKILNITLFRRMFFVSGILLFGFVISKYFPINFNIVIFSEKFFTSVWCINMLYQLNIVCAAGLGASFYALFTANRYLVRRTYDPKYSQVYWIRFWLGILAGFILTNIIIQNIRNIAFEMTPTIIALIGGFSADVVYRILRRFVEMLITFVRGETRDIIEAREKEMEGELKKKEAQLRLGTAVSLAEIYQEAKTKLKADSANRLKEILESLLEGIVETKSP